MRLIKYRIYKTKFIMTSLRKEWFLYVSKTRKRMSRNQKEPVSHRDAMKKASETWPKEKEKLLRRIKREKKQKIAKSNKVKRPKVPDSDEKKSTEK